MYLFRWCTGLWWICYNASQFSDMMCVLLYLQLYVFDESPQQNQYVFTANWKICEMQYNSLLSSRDCVLWLRNCTVIRVEKNRYIKDKEHLCNWFWWYTSLQNMTFWTYIHMQCMFTAVNNSPWGYKRVFTTWTTPLDAMRSKSGTSNEFTWMELLTWE